MLYAALILEREPLQWGQFFSATNLWLQNAGAVAAVGLAIWLVAQLLQRGRMFADLLRDAPPWLAGPLASILPLLAGVSLLGYLVVAVIGLGGLVRVRALGNLMPQAGSGGALTAGDYILSISGLLALAVALTPLFLGLSRLRWGRIWALARLSLKEAIRSRVVLVFGFMALVFLFADWFVPYREQDQVRNYVRMVYWSMTPLFLMTAGLLGAMSIPNDIKSQSIHTIVTKPVEKFEIVLGRFLGYALLLSVGLAVVALVSLGYVVRGVNEAAQKESFKARVPVFATQMKFIGTRDERKGESVGREWEYRGYISGPQSAGKDAVPQYAQWDFDDLPAELAGRDPGAQVTFEYTFDIFRLSKGQENTDIPCTFVFAVGELDERAINDRLEKIRQANSGVLPTSGPLWDELIDRHGVYAAPAVSVTDYHTQDLKVPVAFFKKVSAASADARAKGAPRMKVFVSVDRAPEAQLLGVARRDFYLLAAEQPFWWNFLKGVVGMWCTYMLVLGVAVSCSTYLSGMISWLCTMFLYGAGLFTPYLHQLAENRVEGGGPAEAFYRLGAGRPIAAPLEQSPVTSVIQGTDQAFTWVLRRLLNLIPDVNRFDLHTYVANGFDVPIWNLLVIDNLLPLVGYLLPWAILAYYLMKYREIANPT